MTAKEKELVRSLFSKESLDEPMFVLRASDKLAPALVREWARQFAVHEMARINGNSFYQKKFREALALADAMEAWSHREFPE